MQADNLRVHSENCVVLLLSAWVKSKSAGPGMGAYPGSLLSSWGSLPPTLPEICSPQQLEQLADHVRVARLSPSYLHTVLPNLEWFKRRLEQLQHYMLAMATNAKDEPHWTKKPRDRTIAALPSVSLNAEFTLEQLVSLDKPGGQPWPRSTEKAYANGFFFDLHISPSSTAASASEKILGQYLQIDTSTLNSAFGFFGRETATVSCALKAAGKPCASFSSYMLRSGRGIRDCLGRSGPTVKELVTPFLMDGKLCVSADILDVK